MECNPTSPNHAGWTPLHYAAIYNHLAIVHYLIVKHGVNPSCMDNSGSTPLHFACASGHINIVGFLTNEMNKHLALKDVTSIQDNDGWTPLHYATENNHTELVQYMIDKQEAYPLCRNKHGSMPLHIACACGSIKLVHYLIIEMSKFIPLTDVVCIQNYDRWTPLHYAAQKNHLEIVRFLVAKHRVDLLCQTDLGSAPLHLACAGGHIELVHFLIHEMSKIHAIKDIVSIQDQKGWAPLHSATLKNRSNVVQYLITKQFVDPLRKTRHGSTPLHLACMGGDIGTVSLLVNEMKKYLPLKDVICIRDRNGSTPLHYAAQSYHPELVMHMIIKLQANPLCKTNHGSLPLHCASSRNVAICLVNEMCKHLKLEDVLKICDHGGWTPLHYAVRNNNPEVVKYLIDELRMDPLHQAKDGSTAIHLANDKYMIQYLMNKVKHLEHKGCIQDKNGWTLLHRAAWNNDIQLVKHFVTEEEVDVLS